jgi:hypothetical protein
MGVLVNSKVHNLGFLYHNETICSELTSGCQMTWNYFASNHDKGEVDGAGALLK